MRSSISPQIFNGEFRKIPSLPPFGWELVDSAAGFAEVGDGSLQILYYGREDSELASQLLLLPPGRYRFRAPIKGRLAPGRHRNVHASAPGARRPLIGARNL